MERYHAHFKVFFTFRLFAKISGQNNLALIGPRATSLSDEICKNVAFHKEQIATELELRVSCCTWNVNGGTRSRQINEKLGENLLGDWLLGKVKFHV